VDTGAINLQEGYGRAKRSEIIACRFSLRPPAGGKDECGMRNDELKTKRFDFGSSVNSAFRIPHSSFASDIDEVAGSKL
jgi:hypothetical protein